MPRFGKTLAITAVALVAAAPASACKVKPAPKVKHPAPVVRKAPAARPVPAPAKSAPAPAVTIQPAPAGQVNRTGYCLDGKFYDLIVGQLPDEYIAPVVPGIGQTCDPQ